MAEYSQSQWSDSDSDAVTEPSLLPCPDGNCLGLLSDEEMIQHITNSHRVWHYPRAHHEKDTSLNRIRICYRRRLNYIDSAEGFSSSTEPNTWVGGLINLHNETFLVHIKEMNGLMRFWVTLFAGAEPKKSNEFVVDLALSKFGHSLPRALHHRRHWRGIVKNYGDGECPDFVISNDTLWKDYMFERVEKMRTHYHWWLWVVIEKSASIRSEIESRGGGELILNGMNFWLSRDKKMDPLANGFDSQDKTTSGEVSVPQDVRPELPVPEALTPTQCEIIRKLRIVSSIGEDEVEEVKEAFEVLNMLVKYRRLEI